MPEFLRITLRLLSFLRPYLGRVAVAYSSMLGSTVLVLLPPAILGWVIGVGLNEVVDRDAAMVEVVAWLPFASRIEVWATDASRADILIGAALLIGLLSVMRGVLGFVELYLGAWLSQKAAYDVRNAFFNHLQHLSRLFFS